MENFKNFLTSIIGKSDNNKPLENPLAESQEETNPPPVPEPPKDDDDVPLHYRGLNGEDPRIKDDQGNFTGKIQK